MKFIFHVIYLFMWTFRRKKLKQEMKSILNVPEEEVADGNWILNGLIIKLKSGRELSTQERLTLALFINEYAKMQDEVVQNGRAITVAMSQGMYRRYIGYSIRTEKNRSKQSNNLT